MVDLQILATIVGYCLGSPTNEQPVQKMLVNPNSFQIYRGAKEFLILTKISRILKSEKLSQKDFTEKLDPKTFGRCKFSCKQTRFFDVFRCGGICRSRNPKVHTSSEVPRAKGSLRDSVWGSIWNSAIERECENSKKKPTLWFARLLLSFGSWLLFFEPLLENQFSIIFDFSYRSIFRFQCGVWLPGRCEQHQKDLVRFGNRKT